MGLKSEPAFPRSGQNRYRHVPIPRSTSFPELDRDDQPAFFAVVDKIVVSKAELTPRNLPFATVIEVLVTVITPLGVVMRTAAISRP